MVVRDSVQFMLTDEMLLSFPTSIRTSSQSYRALGEHQLRCNRLIVQYCTPTTEADKRVVDLLIQWAGHPRGDLFVIIRRYIRIVGIRSVIQSNAIEHHRYVCLQLFAVGRRFFDRCGDCKATKSQRHRAVRECARH